jgi:hypothetical protein
MLRAPAAEKSAILAAFTERNANPQMVPGPRVPGNSSSPAAEPSNSEPETTECEAAEVLAWMASTGMREQGSREVWVREFGSANDNAHKEEKNIAVMKGAGVIPLSSTASKSRVRQSSYKALLAEDKFPDWREESHLGERLGGLMQMTIRPCSKPHCTLPQKWEEEAVQVEACISSPPFFCASLL